MLVCTVSDFIGAFVAGVISTLIVISGLSMFTSGGVGGGEG